MACIAAALAPSIITGYTKHPGDAKGWLAFAKRILDRLSVLTNKDSPRTIKSLGVRSKNPGLTSGPGHVIPLEDA